MNPAALNSVILVKYKFISDMYSLTAFDGNLGHILPGWIIYHERIKKTKQSFTQIPRLSKCKQTRYFLVPDFSVSRIKGWSMPM